MRKSGAARITVRCRQDLRFNVFKHLLCDLDGTLVDSSDGILSALRTCLASRGLTPKRHLTNALIGPPLRTMMQSVSGSGDPEVLGEMEMEFRREYDERGYLSAHPYSGIEDVLGELQRQRVQLHIVTNKRLLPTSQILANVGWSHVFDSVSTLDSMPWAATKTDVVARLLSQLRASTSTVAMVGDSSDDADAARCSGVRFGWAAWGYGREPDLGDWGVRLAEAAHLLNFVLRGDVSMAIHAT
jgi:phosphoglycolate phosphatase